MTPILQVITQYCDVYVDDIRIAENKTTDPSLYAWEMWQYLLPAISLFTIPQEIKAYLTDNLTTPQFTTEQTTISTPQTSDFTVNLPLGYDLCACIQKTTRQDGRTILTPINVSYDKTTGIATVTATMENPVQGDLEFDLYKDGAFANDLSVDIMNILGMCFQVVWTDRFNTDWLSNVSKIEDKSFSEQNRANKTRADTERFEMLKRKLAGEMRKYSQNENYKKTVPNNKRLVIS